MIRRDFPEVRTMVRMAGPFNNLGVTLAEDGREKFFEENFGMAADSNFFEVFSIPLLVGEPASVLKEPTDIVLTDETTRRYFGDDDPIGRELTILNQSFIVSGVCASPPANSHMKFDFLMSLGDAFLLNGQENFTSFNTHLYIELRPGAEASTLEAKFPAMVDTYAAAQIENTLGRSWEAYRDEGNGYRYFLQPLTGIHLDPTPLEAGMRPGGNIHHVYALLSIAILVLIIACINFMNLATARSAERSREVGVRKTMGSGRSQILWQFLTESVVIAALAAFVAAVIVQVSLPGFNELTGKQLTLGANWRVIAGGVGVIVFVGLLAGSYPAFVLSAFKPVEVLKGKFGGRVTGTFLRNGLVVFQFVVSIALIASTLIVGRQMAFLQQKSLGFERDQILVVERVFALPDNNAATFIDELRRIPGVEAAAGAFAMIGVGRTGDFFGQHWLPEGSSEILTTKSMVIDDHFIGLTGLEVVAGKPFHEQTNDSLALMLNEAAVRTLGLAEPVGHKLHQVVNTPEGRMTVAFTVIGVVKDFHFQSLRDPITPLTIHSHETVDAPPGYAYVRIASPHLAAAIAAAEQRWATFAPGQPFKYTFLDQALNALYDKEQRVMDLFRVFSALAIIIACVGLFGLAAYTAQRRTKEIGIRKVVGASMSSVVFLLSRDFSRLILLAFLIAAPLAWYLMDRWLSEFAYRIQPGVSVFLQAGLIALTIGWLTISYQSVRTALTNPVKSLRAE